MTKVVSISLGFMLTLATVRVAPAQSSPTDMAVNEAVLRQADTILLRQKLADAENAASRGDLNTAAKFYEDAYKLVTQIGSGVDAEKSQTIAGLASTRMQLARNAQQQGDLRGADTEVTRVLKVDPQNADAIAFKKRNDRMIAAMRGQVPDDTTLQQIPAIANAKTDADTLVRDGQVLYEMGKLEEAEAKLRQALKLDPNNKGAFYYLNLVKQASYKRSEDVHAIDDATRIVQVAKAWEIPTGKMQLPVPNPYASSNLVHTGPGREAIISKLERIRLDSVSYDGLPLSEVVRNLSEQAKLRDPDKKGINFLIDPNVPAPVVTTAPTTTGPGQFNRGAAAQSAPVQIDPNTGLPITAGNGGGGEQVDINSVIVKINPPLTDVSLADVLDAIVQVADHPIKYSIEDYAIVFSLKGPDEPQLFSRSFKVDPNTFYQGLQGVSAFSFGENNNSSSGSGGSGGSSGGGSGGNGQNQGGAVVPVVNVAPGSAGLRSTGNGGGGGGGGGVGGQGGEDQGGVSFVTTTNSTVDVSVAARNFFDTLGVDLDPPKSIFFNDRLGVLYVRATMQDLDTIENAIQSLNEVAPQVHIKARFIEVDQGDNTGLGFDWYLGQFNLGSSIVGQGGNAGSLNVPVSAANPSGTFPGNPFNGTTIPSTVQSLTSGLNNDIPAVGTLTGILTDPNFQVVLHALEQRTGAEELAEPEVTTTSGRQTEMRATQIITVITSYSFQQGAAGTTTTAQ